MKTCKDLFRASAVTTLLFAIGLGVPLQSAFGDFLAMNPPADVDKAPVPGNASCWLATAANMLAGAGYGQGFTVQARAQSIYDQLVTNFGLAQPGWPKTAIDWWLGNRNNWPDNPYDICLVYDVPTSTGPNAYRPRDIGNWLRNAKYVGLVIGVPVYRVCSPIGGEVGGGINGGSIVDGNVVPDGYLCVDWVRHAITAWGDEGSRPDLTGNPTQVWVTDSDRENNGDLQRYNWTNSGQQWLLDYTLPASPLWQIVVLRSLDYLPGAEKAQLVVGSYRIHQRYDKYAATDLHYQVGTDAPICSYRTEIDWPGPNSGNVPDIVEDQNPPRSLFVNWDLRKDSVPFCNWVTITTEFVLPNRNAIWYADVRWTYPVARVEMLPGFRWRVMTPPRLNSEKPVANATGGYVVGSFDIAEITAETGQIQTPRLVGQYRFQHEYLYFQDPEHHEFELTPSQVPYKDRTYFVANLRLGHSYGCLDDEALWQFDQWMTEYPGMYPFIPDEPVRLQLDWEGRLPYPQGVGPLPPCLVFAPGDINRDCIVDFKDFALMAHHWLLDTTNWADQ